MGSRWYLIHVTCPVSPISKTPACHPVLCAAVGVTVLGCYLWMWVTKELLTKVSSNKAERGDLSAHQVFPSETGPGAFL